MNVHPHSWKDTIEVNRPTVEDSARMAVRNIKDLVSSYGSNVVIRLTGDIRDEAALLLIMDAGFIPKVIVEKRDDFIDYLLERYVLETVNSIPDSCILVADTYDGSNPGVVHHYPVSEWEPSMVWLYVFIKAVPFHPFYTRNIWNQNIE